MVFWYINTSIYSRNAYKCLCLYLTIFHSVAASRSFFCGFQETFILALKKVLGIVWCVFWLGNAVGRSEWRFYAFQLTFSDVFSLKIVQFLFISHIAIVLEYKYSKVYIFICHECMMHSFECYGKVLFEVNIFQTLHLCIGNSLRIPELSASDWDYIE